MIYFIGGAPRTGKTTAMQKLVNRKPMLAASTDAIRNVAKGVTKASENPRLHKIEQGHFDSPQLQAEIKSDPQTVLQREIEQSEEVWKSTLDFIGYYQRDGKDSAVEGVAVLPDKLIKADFEYTAVFLALKADFKDMIISHAHENEHDWLHRYHDEELESFCDFLSFWNSYYSIEAKKLGFTVIEVGSDNFSDDLDNAVDILLN